MTSVPRERQNEMDFHLNTRNNPATVVTKAVTLELVDTAGAATPLETELSYDVRDPFAVTATFRTIAGAVGWTFGRDLLVAGLTDPTGDGDVHVWPCLDDRARAVVVIELCSPDGEALVQASTSDIRSFLDETTEVVPIGAESELLDLDATIAAIFAAA